MERIMAAAVADFTPVVKEEVKGEDEEKKIIPLN